VHRRLYKDPVNPVYCSWRMIYVDRMDSYWQPEEPASGRRRTKLLFVGSGGGFGSLFGGTQTSCG